MITPDELFWILCVLLFVVVVVATVKRDKDD